MNLGFKDQFCPFVEDGSKRHTMRAGDRWRVGMRADLFQRPRQKGMRLMFRAVVNRVESVVIQDADGYLIITVDGTRLAMDEARSFLWRDGFRGEGSSMAQARKFWSKQLAKAPFVGQIIHWDYDNRFTDTADTCYYTSFVLANLANTGPRRLKADRGTAAGARRPLRKACVCHLDGEGFCPTHGNIGARD
jgi:hypothetical protein